jgi:hypothetical protein
MYLILGWLHAHHYTQFIENTRKTKYFLLFLTFFTIIECLHILVITVFDISLIKYVTNTTIYAVKVGDLGQWVDLGQYGTFCIGRHYWKLPAATEQMAITLP